MPNPGSSIPLALTLLLSLPAEAASIHAVDVVGFGPGPQSSDVEGSPPASFGTPDDALGPPDQSVVSLGERGRITLSLPLPVADGPGADLIVFENGFSFTDDTTGESFVFAELGFVEVSSDGVTFARFPTLSPLLEPIGEFGVISGNDVPAFAGFAGLDPSGDPFDLADLADVPVVQAGIVDTGAIRFVRVRDVVGDGSDFDSRGNPVFDPWPTDVPSSGFDLDAVTAFYPVPEPGSGLPVALATIAVLWMRRSARLRARRIGAP